MKFTASKSSLVEALGVVERGIPTKIILPITDGVLVEVVDGNLFITSNNLELSIRSVIEGVDAEEETAFVLPSRFVEVVKRLPEESINIATISGGDVEVTSGKSKFVFHPLSAEDFPISTPEEEWSNWERIDFSASELKEILELITFAVAKDESKYTFLGVLLKVSDDGNIVFYASDTYRLARLERKVDTISRGLRLLVPGKTLNIVSKMLDSDDEAVSCYFSERELVFVYKQYTISGRLIEDKYPDVDRVFPDSAKTIVTIDRESLEGSLSRAILSTGRGTPKGHLSIDNDTVGINTRDEIGSCDESINAEIKGEPCEEAIFNIKYLIEPLKIIKTKKVEIEFNGDSGPCIIKHSSDSWEYKYLALPIKREESTTR